MDEAASDQRLVARTLAGDLRAFEALVGRHQAVVLRVAARVVGPSEAEDVAQDALLRAFHRLEQLRDDASFRSWLLRITHNTALDALSRRPAAVAARPSEAADDGAPEPAEVAAAGPAELLERAERRDRLDEKLRLLSPNHRAVLVLRDLEGLEYNEIAEITSSPLGSVKGRLFRARAELIELLRTNTYDWELPR